MFTVRKRRIIVTFLIRALVVFVFLFSSSLVFGQRVEDGWKGLLPFKSTKADVEKLFGSGQRSNYDRHYQFEYKNEIVIFSVDYSGDPCDPSLDTVDRYDLPAATILSYEIRLSKPIPLREFTFDVNRFERTVMIYGPNNEPRAISYVQWEFELWKIPNQMGVGNGIEIYVAESGDKELATGFLYSPPYDRTKFKCPDFK
jgi:hypothetical protein